MWGADEPSSRIGQVTSRNVKDDVSMPVKVMAVYASDAMTIDVVLDDVRPDGAFVPTELLDAPGTPCEITLLPDGQAPLPIAGEVVATRAVADRKGPAGLEVRFTSMTDGVRLWLELFARRRAT